MKYKILIAVILSVITNILTAQKNNPSPNPAAVVISDNARFTVLTPNVIRMEWAENAIFEDNATLTFINRNLPVPAYKTKIKKGWLEIKTAELTLYYKVNSKKFDATTLKIEFSQNGRKKEWNPEIIDQKNLKGTIRTLDGTVGKYQSNNKNDTIQLETGILSREGWTMIDDSRRPLFDNSEWPWVMARPESKSQDLYFFVYGDDYKKMLYNFSLLAGKIALPPKFTFGVWWSRYWEYSDVELKNLVQEFQSHNIPLDVLVIDMDWHKVNNPAWFDAQGRRLKDQSGEDFGWTGFSWNRSLFPDPKGFLKWTNDNHIYTSMNLHPASGIQPHEDQYEDFAKAMGVDPSTKKYIPFDITNKKFAQNYMDILLHPYEKDGVDFWWLDWQQWGSTKIEGVNPTFYLNYVHTSDMERRGIRPLIFHRWGGIGNHRYQIGFSGDTKICWESLNYQPYFTSTASNVLFGFWSHDIGGHHFPDKYDPELYTRWVQWGAFSPVFRTHCTKDPSIERKIWNYPDENFQAMSKAIKLRYSLFPYIYTNARCAYDSAVSILRPMYYDYPKIENSYQFKSQYMFGADMLVAPVTHPVEKDSIKGKAFYTMQKVWLPAGEWYEWNSGTLINGNQVIDRPYMLDEIPIYVRSGAVICMQPDMNRIGEKNIDPLIVNIFPGKSGKTRLYDDAGNDLGFKKNDFTFTDIRFEKKDSTLTAEILPIEGNYPGMPEYRHYELRLPLTFIPISVKVNGEEVAFSDQEGWSYKSSQLMTVVKTKQFSVNDKVNIEIQFPNYDIHQLSGVIGLSNKIFYASRQVISSRDWKHQLFNFDDVIFAGQTLNRISLKADNQNLLTEIDLIKRNYQPIVNAFEKHTEINGSKFSNLYDLLKAAEIYQSANLTVKKEKK
ncbi:Glycoside hydrolase, family 31 [uncultured Paludibacter sp.]|nr:Glycoside hydrolase, family 31 [uncultured Paludibacter sp.]